MASQAVVPAEGGEVTEYSGGILAVIERAVRDPNVDVDKMERLLAMQERVLEQEAKRAFTTALRAAKAEIKPVLRNQFNDQTKSGYADLEAVANAIDPIMERHGFVFSFGTGRADLENHYRVTCDLMHEGGHERPYYADVPADMLGMKGNQNKTATHGFGSTMTYGRRYLKMLIADVATKDDDGNGASDYVAISADQCAELRKLIATSGVTEEMFCSHIQIGTLPELAAKNFDRAKTMLSQRIQREASNANH